MAEVVALHMEPFFRQRIDKCLTSLYKTREQICLSRCAYFGICIPVDLNYSSASRDARK